MNNERVFSIGPFTGFRSFQNVCPMLKITRIFESIQNLRENDSEKIQRYLDELKRLADGNRENFFYRYFYMDMLKFREHVPVLLKFKHFVRGIIIMPHFSEQVRENFRERQDEENLAYFERFDNNFSPFLSEDDPEERAELVQQIYPEDLAYFESEDVESERIAAIEQLHQSQEFGG